MAEDVPMGALDATPDDQAAMMPETWVPPPVRRWVKQAAPQDAAILAGAGRGLGDVLAAPGRALASQTPISTGEMIKPAADIAGLTTLGAGAVPAEANSLRAGLKALAIKDAIEAEVASPDIVRLYRGGGSNVGGSKWVTTNRKYAEGYTTPGMALPGDTGGGNYLQYVDIPKTDPRVQMPGGQTTHSFEAPADIADQLKPYYSRPGLSVAIDKLQAQTEPYVSPLVKDTMDKIVGIAREPIAAGDTRVSTRFPTAVKAEENPLREHLSIGTPEMKLDPEAFEHNVGLLSRYPGFARLKGMSSDEAAQAYVDQAADNMRYLYDRSPTDIRLRSPRWYEGANEIADAFAQRWGIPRQSASAALAALSPQKDWFMNGSLGERVGDIVVNNPRATTDMINWVRSQPKIMGQPGMEEALRQMAGRRLDQVDPDHAALFVRAFDEAHNPRAYRSILPEGYFGDFVRTQKGEPAKLAWGTFNDIDKATRAIRSGGDMDTISKLLGEKHKVRSFYNNIENPYDARYGDITGDTHQVAAAQMRPLSGNSEAVIQHLASGGPAGSVNAKSSAVTGVKGTYGLVADATRKFANEAGMLPRAGQSATWEPVRELFPAEWKNAKNAAAVDDIWKAYDHGTISVDEARRRIFELAGGIGTPEWARHGIEARSPQLGSTYR